LVVLFLEEVVVAFLLASFRAFWDWVVWETFLFPASEVLVFWGSSLQIDQMGRVKVWIG